MGSEKRFRESSLRAVGEAGFTVSELLVVMLVAALLAFVALPPLGQLSGTFDRVNAKSFLVQDLKRAQAETITQGCRGIMVINGAGTGYSFGCDYLAYDSDGNPQPDKVFFSRNLPGKVTISASGPIIINSRGQTVDTAFILSSISITLSENLHGTVEVFSSGTLTGTGIFSFST